MFKLFPQGPRFLILFSQEISDLLKHLLVAAVRVFYFHHFYMKLDNLEMDIQLNVLFFFLFFLKIRDKTQCHKTLMIPAGTLHSCSGKKTPKKLISYHVFENLHCIFFSWTHQEKNSFCLFPGKNPIRKCDVMQTKIFCDSQMLALVWAGRA